jgi:hypothetical protein
VAVATGLEPETETSCVTGRRSPALGLDEFPYNSDGCRVSGTCSQERTIDCRGLI